MSDNATPSEITRDIVVAMISRHSAYIGSGSHKDIADQVAEVFEIIYRKVYEKWSGE